MAYIDFGNDLPGIRGPMAFRPEINRSMCELAEVLLRDKDNTLTRGERELIGTYVSYLNDCYYCQHSHGALAGHYMNCEIQQIEAIKRDFLNADLSAKMKALLVVAGSVQKGGKHVSSLQVEAAKTAGASDREIHDTVLIAALFCMYNRYVDGLGTYAPPDKSYYINRAPDRAEEGYLNFDVYK